MLSSTRWLVLIIMALLLGCSNVTPAADEGQQLSSFASTESTLVRTDAVGATIWPADAPTLNNWSAVFSVSGSVPSWGSYPYWRRLSGTPGVAEGSVFRCDEAEWVVLRYGDGRFSTADATKVMRTDIIGKTLVVAVTVHRPKRTRMTPAPADLILKIWGLQDRNPHRIVVECSVYEQVDDVTEVFEFREQVDAPVIIR